MANKKSLLTELDIREVAFCRRGMNKNALVALWKSDDIGKAETKREGGEDFPASAFAYVPDAEKPSTWKLRLWDSVSDKETAQQVGRALAAIGPGYRGQKVEIPSADMAGVKRKIAAAWRKTHPDAKPGDMPSILKSDNTDNPSAGSPGESSRNKGASDMDPKELEKKLGELEGQVETLTAERDEAVTKAEAAEAKAKELEAKAEEDKDVEKQYIEMDGEKIEKSALPAPVLKRLEAQQAAIEKMQAEAEAEKLCKRASEELPNLAGTPDQKGKLLKAIDSMDEADRDEVMKSLKAADAAVSKMFEEVGKSTEDEASPTVKLDKAVKKYAAENEMPYESAFADFIKTAEGAELRKAADAERN